MLDAPPSTSQATYDELAALYLRDRDTPCPSCNYNRRDGTTSTCPECGTEFQLTETVASTNADYKTLTRAILLLTTLTALILATHHLINLIQTYLAWGSIWDPAIRHLTITSSIGIAISLIAAIKSSKSWLKARKKQALPARQVLTPVVIIFILSVAQVIFWALTY